MPDYRPNVPLSIVVLLGITCGCHGASDSEEDSGMESIQQASIDQRSYRLGSLAAFAEMVEYGVKELALSAAVDPTEMDAMEEEARRIAAEHNVEVYRETDFLVTDLFSSELTEGKDVLLIYRGETKQAYMDLKAEKLRLQRLGRYEGEARREIARRLGILLSYPPEKIEEFLDT